MQFPINLDGIEPARPETIKLPLDKYPVVVVDCQYKQAKSGGNNTRLVFTLRVTRGQYSGVELSHGINYTHESVQAQAIGRQELASIFWATIKRATITDTRELYNIEFLALIGPGDPDSNGNTFNDVKGIYLASGEAVTRLQQAAPAFAPPQAPAAPQYAPPAPQYAPGQNLQPSGYPPPPPTSMPQHQGPPPGFAPPPPPPPQGYQPPTQTQGAPVPTPAKPW